MLTFGEKIKTARENKKMSRKELAEQIGVTRSAIWHWENNLREPGGKLLLIIMRILGIAQTEMEGKHGIETTNNKERQ